MTHRGGGPARLQPCGTKYRPNASRQAGVTGTARREARCITTSTVAVRKRAAAEADHLAPERSHGHPNRFVPPPPSGAAWMGLPTAARWHKHARDTS